MNNSQEKKAEQLLQLHHSDKLLVLPNIWDVIGAKLLEHEGFPAVATASAAVAYSNGYFDGEKIAFIRLLSILKDICDNTSLPVTADIERGYAGNSEELSGNIRNLIRNGVVGINIEDSDADKKLIPCERQCEKIQVARKVSEEAGIYLVINARTDIFIQEDYPGNRVEDAIARAREYSNAGADCFYPILCPNDELVQISSRIDMPINVIATKDTFPVKKLEEIGIARLSLGPALLRAALTKMKEIMGSLKDPGHYETFTGNDILTSPDIQKIIQLVNP